METKSLQLTYKLKHPVQIAGNAGKLEEGHTLLLTAPSRKQLSLATYIKQAYLQAQMSAGLRVRGLAASEEKEQEVSPVEDTRTHEEKIRMHIQFLYVGEADMEKVFKNFEDLLCSEGICLVNNSIKMTGVIFSYLSMEDLELLLGEYINHFFI